VPLAGSASRQRQGRHQEIRLGPSDHDGLRLAATARPAPLAARPARQFRPRSAATAQAETGSTVAEPDHEPMTRVLALPSKLNILVEKCLVEGRVVADGW